MGGFGRRALPRRLARERVADERPDREQAR